MNWIFYSLIPAFLWAIVNHVDKYLIDKYCKGLNVGSLVIFSSLIGLPVMLVMYFFNQDVLSIPYFDILLIISAGIFYIFAVIFYLYALSKDEASTVVPHMMLIPAVSAVLSYFIIGEKLSTFQIAGITFIVFGSLFITAEIKSLRSMKLRFDVLLFMVFFALFVSLNAILFKQAMISDYDFWVIAFWEHVGFLIVGIFCLLFVKSYRSQFIALVKENSVGVFSLNLSNELITITGNLFFHYAVFLAPVAIVEAFTEGMQPIFVLIIAMFLSKYFPNIESEDLKKSNLTQKIFSIILMIFGLYLLA